MLGIKDTRGRNGDRGSHLTIWATEPSVVPAFNEDLSLRRGNSEKRIDTLKGLQKQGPIYHEPATFSLAVAGRHGRQPPNYPIKVGCTTSGSCGLWH